MRVQTYNEKLCLSLSKAINKERENVDTKLYHLPVYIFDNVFDVDKIQFDGVIIKTSIGNTFKIPFIFIRSILK